jgi:hypothetical protein
MTLVGDFEMKKYLILSALLSAGLLACGDTSDTPTPAENNVSGKGDQSNNEEYIFANGVADCETTRTTVLEDPNTISNSDVMEAVGAYTSCLAEANNEVIAVIEAAHSEIAFEMEADVTAAFEAYRTAQNDLCTSVVPAYELGQGSMGYLIQMDCIGDGELQLSKLIAAYVDAIGGEANIELAVNAEDFRELHPECFEVYDAEMDAANSQSEMISALYTLGACSRDLARDYEQELALGLESFGQADDYQQAIDRVMNAFDQVEAANQNICSALVNASSERGGTLTNIYAAECVAITDMWTLSLIKSSGGQG